MRIIFLYFCIIYTLVMLVARMEGTLMNNKELDKFKSNSYDNFNLNRKYNPDTDLNTAELIKKYGYPSETHVVTTEDDYILTLHRIPGKPNSHPVLLQHGIITTSAIWLITGPKNSLAFILADNGYDVWLGNFRGNTYSKAHKRLSTKDAKFWDFSWHEMGIYDLPAMISYITNMKKSNVTYIGHSMGVTAFYVMSIMRPDIASRVQMMFSLAPVAYLKHIKTPLRLLAPFANDLHSILHTLGIDEFLSKDKLISYFTKYGCTIDILENEICINILFSVTGFDEYQFNRTLLPVILGHIPAGTSVKTLVHYAQEVQSGQFRQFDYGRKQNLKIYNSVEPPNYNLSKITVPIIIYYGNNDWLANVEDVLRLSRELNSVTDLYKIPYTEFNHADFILAIDAPKLVYSRILRTMKGN